MCLEGEVWARTQGSAAAEVGSKGNRGPVAEELAGSHMVKVLV
jgi:hypothetical protein